MNYKLIICLILSIFFYSCDKSPVKRSSKTVFLPENNYKNSGFALVYNENLKVAIITPDKDIIPNSETLNPAYIVFENYEIILKWNRSLRFALAVCTLKDKIKNEL